LAVSIMADVEVETQGPAQPEGDITTSRKPRDHQRFFDKLTGYTEAEWERLILYLYRLEPITDRFAGGNSIKFIAKYVHAIDEEVVMKDHGSGKYRLMLNESTAASKKTKPIASVEFAILNPAYPPKIPLGEWIEDARNKQWAWAKAAPVESNPETGKTEHQGHRDGLSASDLFRLTREMVRELAPKQDANSVTTAVVDALKTSYSEAFKVAQVQARGGDDSKLFDLIKAILQKPEKTADDPHQKFLYDQLAEERKRNHELMMKLLEKKEGGDEKAGITDRILERAIDNLLDGGDEGARGPRGKWAWAAPYLPQALDIAGKAVNGLTQMLTFGLGRRGAAAATNPAPGGTAAPPEHPQQIQPAPAKGDPMMNMLLQQIGDPLLNHLHNGQRGEEFGDWLVTGFGTSAPPQVKGLGKDKIIAAIKLTPLWPNIAPVEQRFSEFLDELLAWTPDWEEAHLRVCQVPNCPHPAHELEDEPEPPPGPPPRPTVVPPRGRKGAGG
jgi:hypothetical protein